MDFLSRSKRLAKRRIEEYQFTELVYGKEFVKFKAKIKESCYERDKRGNFLLGYGFYLYITDMPRCDALSLLSGLTINDDTKVEFVFWHEYDDSYVKVDAGPEPIEMDEAIDFVFELFKNALRMKERIDYRNIVYNVIGDHLILGGYHYPHYDPEYGFDFFIRELNTLFDFHSVPDTQELINGYKNITAYLMGFIASWGMGYASLSRYNDSIPSANKGAQRNIALTDALSELKEFFALTDSYTKRQLLAKGVAKIDEWFCSRLAKIEPFIDADILMKELIDEFEPTIFESWKRSK